MVARQQECMGLVLPRDEVGVNRGSRNGIVLANRLGVRLGDIDLRMGASGQGPKAAMHRSSVQRMQRSGFQSGLMIGLILFSAFIVAVAPPEFPQFEKHHPA